MSCGHPRDVRCNRCAFPAMTDLETRIAHLDAKLLGLNLYGRTDEDREEAARVFEQLRALRVEQREREMAMADTERPEAMQ